jgi:PBP1b-binding outer membrane lipoprotein LpoB
VPSAAADLGVVIGHTMRNSVSKTRTSMTRSLLSVPLLAAIVFVAGCAGSPESAAPASSVTTTVTVPTVLTTHATSTVQVPTTITVVSSATVTATVTQAVAAPAVVPENVPDLQAADQVEVPTTPEARALVNIPAPSVNFANCTEARAAGAAPVRRGDPGYSSKLDRDNDGVGCE